MTGKINRLSESVIGKMAAGEVVERPSAVIKELVENSIDADANSIIVQIRDGGTTYIRVTDNGMGIPSDEVPLALERHATSKVTSIDDIYTVKTLGFRGEALASIAAVSRIVLITRVRHAEYGISVTSVAGRIEQVQDEACPEGTSVTVKDLFFNVPVRLKFLKKPAYEGALINDLLTRFILSHPEISIKFINDGKTIYQSAGNGLLDAAVFCVYGRQALQGMHPIDGSMNGIILSGYVGVGDLTRNNRGGQSFFMNGRYIKSFALSKTLERACRESIISGSFPICVLHLKMPYDQVDVNVHPNKMEVRFQNEKAVFESIYTIIAEKLGQDKLATRFTEKKMNEVSAERNIHDEIARPLHTEPIPLPPNHVRVFKTPSIINDYKKGATYTIPFKSYPDDIPKHDLKDPPAPYTQVILEDTNKKNNVITTETPSGREQFELAVNITDIKVFGTYLNTYVVLQYNGKLALIDQHAAHERLLYDEMMQGNDATRRSQMMLVPQIVGLSPKEMVVYQENADVLLASGFEIDVSGENMVQVHAVPAVLGEMRANHFMMEILGELDQKIPLSLEKRRSIILQKACKHAVKAGEAITKEDMEYILGIMIQNGVSPTCPHGRPLVIMFDKTEIEKRFRRR